MRYTCSLNPLEIGTLVSDWSQTATLYLETDKSRFDASVSAELLELEYNFYEHLGLS